jgi:protein-S-isoprenylcysteine O-methyltransferase Ste14
MREQNTDHAQVLAPPPMIFVGYLIGALLLNWLLPFSAQTIPLRIVGGFALLAGIVSAGSAIFQMRKLHISPDPRQPVSALVTSGPYRFTRNPIYLGFFLIYLGFTLLDGTLWGLIASPFLLWTITQSVIHAEETYLDGKFGASYKEYRSHVRRWV